MRILWVKANKLLPMHSRATNFVFFPITMVILTRGTSVSLPNTSRAHARFARGEGKPCRQGRWITFYGWLTVLPTL